MNYDPLISTASIRRKEHAVNDPKERFATEIGLLYLIKDIGDQARTQKSFGNDLTMMRV